MASDWLTYFFVMMENGEPIGVARADREDAAREWQAAAPNRRLVRVEECR